MEFNEYQQKSRVNAIYPEVGNNFIFPTLGLVGEAGEVAEKIKKLIRDKNVAVPNQMAEFDKQELVKELGDVLWYLAQLASEIDVPLSHVAELNIEKVSSRRERRMLSGEGDNR